MGGLADRDVIVLCGGLGTRLQSVLRDRPKPMADIHGHPFLSLIVEHFRRHGARRFIFSTGHRGEMIEDWFRRQQAGYEATFIRDPSPLGTGGALAHAITAVRSDPFLVVNGDSLCEIDSERLLRFHALKRACATIVATRQEDRQDTGAVILGEDDRVLSIVEKPRIRARGYDNAGIYVFDHTIQSHFPATGAWSLEHDLFPRLVSQRLYAFVTASPLHDIGTPERLARFRDIWRHTSARFPPQPVPHAQGAISS